MAGSILLLGDDLGYLSELSNELRAVSRSVTISAVPNAVRQALEAGLAGHEAAVVCLDGTENVGDIHSLLEAHPGTTFLFLSRTTPPRSALAHAVHSSGAGIMPRQEGPIVVAATLIALLAQKARDE
jgi:hypothetical protein